MASIELTQTRDRLSELVEQVEAGETVEILRDGKAVARLTLVPPERKAIDIELLRATTAGMRTQTESAGEFVRRMRDTDRY